MDQLEFETVRQQLKSGDNQYLKVIFEKYGNYCLQNIMRKFNCSTADAEDILIDSIINFRDKILSGKLTKVTSVRNYLYTTCVNMKRERNYYAERIRSKEYEVKQHLYSSVEKNEDNDELLRQSVSSFKQLGKSCQEILRYFYIYKLTMKEIADRMNLGSTNAAKVKKARCYKKWQESIKKMQI